MLSLGSARQLATQTIRKAQKRYKTYYDQKATPISFRVGDWVHIFFPHEESGKNRKLSKPWHGPYRVISRDDPTLVCTKAYSLSMGRSVFIKAGRTPAQSSFQQDSFGTAVEGEDQENPPRWVEQLLSARLASDQVSTGSAQDGLTSPSSGTQPQAPCDTREFHSDSHCSMQSDVQHSQIAGNGSGNASGNADTVIRNDLRSSSGPRGGDIRDNFIQQDSSTKDDGPEHLESKNQDVVTPTLRDRTAVPERDLGSQDSGGLPVTRDRSTIAVGHSGTATADTHSETQQNTGKFMDNSVNTGGNATTAGGTHRKEVRKLRRKGNLRQTVQPPQRFM